MPRLTREERKAETRTALIAAARKVFARRGFEAATVEEIAAEAGFTTGAVYSNFGGKDDLVMAVVDETVELEIRDFAERFAQARSVDERARGGADRWMELLHEPPDYFPLFVELCVAGRRDPELRKRLAIRSGAIHDQSARLLSVGAGEVGVELDREFAERLAVAINALGTGLALEKLIAPEAVPDDLYGWTLSLLFGALAQQAGLEIPE
jgi:AcrR family transcriptional regulator